MSKPVKPGEVPAKETEQQTATRISERDRYRAEILSASAGELDKADQAELGKMISEGFKAMRANGEIR